MHITTGWRLNAAHGKLYAMSNVFVGLSGGVDSSTSAALLQEQGHDVTGVFIKIWQPEFIECTWREDRLDAMRVCAALSIPFREIDLSREYKEQVIDSMISDYQRGITPNPDILCNEKIKFGAFFKWAIAHGADSVATGHYAQTKEVDGKTVLVRGLDPAKDQSYFIFRIGEDELKRVVFPIGSMEKKDVRAAARRFDLPVSDKPDSQGLCFVGDVSIRDFLKRYITLESGSVLDESGKIIGGHEGAALYTIGQRHGFIISDNADGTSHYIVAVDTKKNTITVSSERARAAHSNVRIRDMHWIGSPVALPLSCSAQIRYHATPAAANISEDEKGIRCAFDEPQIASPGQSIVLYEGDICLGGGTIDAF